MASRMYLIASSLSRLGAKPPSSPTAVLCPAFLSTALRLVEDLGDHADALGEDLGPDRHDHEFLEVDLVVGVLAAVDDVGHRERAGPGRWPRRCSGRAAGRGPAAAALAAARLTPRIALAPELALVRGAVGLDHGAVEPDLVGRVAADGHLGQRGVDVATALVTPLPQIALLVAVAEFDRLVDARAGAEGTAARPSVPSARITSTSTVGLPRLSRISRARTDAIGAGYVLIGA